uniref:Uncharacterized protein n=1 Tax=Rhabditophanes sp. KR3021 TaxID=114890 RepID=A0AC35U8M8_9BILA
MENFLSRFCVDIVYTRLLQNNSDTLSMPIHTILKGKKTIQEKIEAGIKLAKSQTLSLTFARIITNPADLFSLFIIFLFLSKTSFSKYQKVDGDYLHKCPPFSLKLANASWIHLLETHSFINITYIVLETEDDSFDEESFVPSLHAGDQKKVKQVLAPSESGKNEVFYLNEPDDYDLGLRTTSGRTQTPSPQQTDDEINIVDNNELWRISPTAPKWNYKFTYNFCTRLVNVFYYVSLTVSFISTFLELTIMFLNEYLL